MTKATTWKRSEELIARPSYQETVWEAKAFGFVMKVECRTPPSPADLELDRGSYEWSVSEDYKSPRLRAQFPSFSLPHLHLTDHSHTLAIAQATCTLIAQLLVDAEKVAAEIEEVIAIGQEKDENDEE